MGTKKQPKVTEIVATLERHFGRKVLKVTAPGGKGRASYRAYFKDQSVIVTYRLNLRRTELEAHVLKSLSGLSEDLPRFLGYEDGLLIQSDVGENRLSQTIQTCGPTERSDMAAAAVAAIFRIHSASRQTSLTSELPHLGGNVPWVQSVVGGVDEIAGYVGRSVPSLDRETISEQLMQPPAQFLKWDCRSGNAALDEAGKLRWFDFEYAGLRHGAEDFAWLIGDEIWPVPPSEMLEVISEAFDPSCGHQRDDYMSYLSLYTTFHTIQRIMLIVSEVQRRGWSPQSRAVRYDKVGTHPMLGVRAAEVAAFCAGQNSMTQPLVPLFEAVAAMFASKIEDNQQRLAG